MTEGHNALSSMFGVPSNTFTYKGILFDKEKLEDNPFWIVWPQMYQQHDFKLEENMIINIDMPHVEYGWGSIYIEDTLLITKDGYEGLTSLDTKLIIKTN